jgi:hypothetical protein
MEGRAAQSPRRERRRPSLHSPNSSRTVSRSSTRASSARMPPQTMSDSSSNINSPPGQRNPQPFGSRFPQRRGSMGSNTDRPPTPVSKSSIRGSQSSTHQEPASTLLQEKLQRERRSEIQRNLNRLADEMGPADSPQAAVASTPVRCATADGKRPGSSDANGDAGKKKGLALKEMEQVPMPSLLFCLHTQYTFPLPYSFARPPRPSSVPCLHWSHILGHRLVVVPAVNAMNQGTLSVVADQHLRRPCQPCTSRTLTSNSSSSIVGNVSPCWRRRLRHLKQRSHRHRRPMTH